MAHLCLEGLPPFPIALTPECRLNSLCGALDVTGPHLRACGMTTRPKSLKLSMAPWPPTSPAPNDSTARLTSNRFSGQIRPSETWPRGRRRSPAKGVGPQGSHGFESHRLRQKANAQEKHRSTFQPSSGFSRSLQSPSVSRLRHISLSICRSDFHMPPLEARLRAHSRCRPSDPKGPYATGNTHTLHLRRTIIVIIPEQR